MTLVIGIAREVANVTIAPVLIPRFPTIINDTFRGNQTVNFTRPVWQDAILNTLMIYPDAVGSMAYLIICIIPFAMMWISNGNMKMAAVVGLIVSLFVFAFLPATYVTAGYFCFVISFVSAVWGIFRP